MKLHITTTIKPDGSGENEIVFGLDTYQVPIGNIFWTSVNLNRKEMMKEGATVIDWEEGTYRGFKATYRFSDLDEMATQLTDTRISDETYSNSHLRVIFSKVETSFDNKGNFNFVARNDYAGSSLDFDLGNEFYFTIVMPGKIINNSNDDAVISRTANSITYDQTRFIGQAYEINVTSKVSVFSLSMLSGANSVICLIAIFFLIAAFLIIKSSYKGFTIT